MKKIEENDLVLYCQPINSELIKTIYKIASVSIYGSINAFVEIELSENTKPITDGGKTLINAKFITANYGVISTKAFKEKYPEVLI